MSILLRDLFPDQDKETKNEMVDKGISKLRSHVRSAREREAESETCYGQRLLREAIPNIVKGIKDWCSQQEKSPVPSVAYEKLSELDNHKVASYISLKSVIDSLSQRRSLASAAIRIGALIEDELRFRSFSTHPKWDKILQGANKRPNYSKKRYYIIHSQKGEAAKQTTEPWERWATRTKLHVGTVLITLIKDHTGLIDYVMVNDQNGKYKATRYITPTQKTREWIEGMIKHNEMLTPFWMPLTEFPKQWKDKWSGGYHEEYGLPPLPLIKLRNKAFLRKSKEPMTDVMTALNHLQNTSFKVNGAVLNFLEEVWERNIIVGDLPAQSDEELPPFPPEGDEKAIVDWKRRASEIYQHNTSTKSRRILVLNTLGLAKRFAKKPRLFLPHQCDFRGRAYAVPSYLNHMGPDFAKALLTFEKGLEISNINQRDWLWIHGANTYGVKGTFANRLEWVYNHRQLIQAVGENPISQLDFIMEADEPFQFVAFCDELNRFLKTPKGQPFITHLPCQMDASNNGLQILGLLTRDRSSCEATNVSRTAEPQDIYQIVADTTIQLLSEDTSEKGKMFAKRWIEFGIDRNCTKRPCMTQPYGSTPHSCRGYVNDWYVQQVKRNNRPDPFPNDDRFKATSYLSTKVWESINRVVGRPRQAMAWLQKVARILAEDHIPMEWVSPSGFHVHQEYNKTEEKSIRTKIGDKIYKVSFKNDIGKLSAKRQAQGSSPNFVHSLDAACLHLTVNKMGNFGIDSFAMVHDSYGTHATNCPMMANIIRETFYDVFSLDQLQLLKEKLESTKAVEGQLPALPDYGDFDISEVLQSNYMFA